MCQNMKRFFMKRNKQIFIKKSKICFYDNNNKKIKIKKVKFFYNNLGIRRMIICFTVCLMV